jgi:hypothetical protein
MAYEVWETTSGNLAGAYTSREKALSAVRAFVARTNEGEAESLALVHVGRRGRHTTIATGRDLVRMARQPAPGFFAVGTTGTGLPFAGPISGPFTQIQ